MLNIYQLNNVSLTKDHFLKNSHIHQVSGATSQPNFSGGNCQEFNIWTG